MTRPAKIILGQPDLTKHLMDENHGHDENQTYNAKRLLEEDQKDPIARRTRAASRRNVLGDVSNMQSAQVPIVPAARINRVPRAKGYVQHVDATMETSEPMMLVSQRPMSVLQKNNTTLRWDDLDAEDAGDPSMVSEYVNDIFAYLYQLERKTMCDPDYMARQKEITWKMRSVLIDWLVEVHWKLKLLPETLFLSVNLMDRFLTARSVSLPKFQLVGISATIIASKYEETLSPSVNNFVQLSDGTYKEQEIQRAECYMLNSLDYDLSTPTPYVFLRRLSKADNYDIQTRTLAKYFLEICLLEPVFLHFPPSLQAAASLFLARKMLNKGEWNSNLIHYSGDYSAQDCLPMVEELISFFQKPIKYEVIYKKYASKKFMKASVFVRDYIEKYHPWSSPPDAS